MEQDQYSISQLTEDLTAADSDLMEVSKDNGDGTFTSRKQTRSTLLEGTASEDDLVAHATDTDNPHGVTAAQIGAPTTAQLTSHTSNTSNPHNTTKEQVGLSNVDNTADTAKPISTATQAALDAKANTSHTHTIANVTGLQDALDSKAIGAHQHTIDHVTGLRTALDAKADDADLHSHTNKTVLDNTTASFTTADETKLDGIAMGATVNSSDATLLNRANHTGVQPQNTVADLVTDLAKKADVEHTHDDRYFTETEVAALLNTKADASSIPATIVESLIAGSNVTIDDSDPANPVISSTGGGGGGGAVDSVNGQTGVVNLDADDIPDGASAKQYTATEKSKLSGIADGADANVQSDWAQANSAADDFIKNKPTLGSAAAANTTDFAGAAQGALADTAVQPGDLATVATTGAYADLSGLPAVPDALTDLDTTVTGVQLNDLKAKLDGIEAGAQVNEVFAADIADFETTTELNARDTANRDRANHTGEQTIATITGLQTALDGKSATGHTHDSDDIQVPVAGTNLTQVVLDVSTSLEEKAVNSQVVHRIGTETVDGVKTFLLSPVVPTPTTDMQAATKKYVDDNAGGGGATINDAATNTTETWSSDKIATEIASAGGGGGSSASLVDTYHFQYIPISNDPVIRNTGATLAVGSGIDATLGLNHVVDIGTTAIKYGKPVGLFNRPLSGRVLFSYMPNVVAGMKLFVRFGTSSAYSATYTLIKSIGFRYEPSGSKFFATTCNGTSETTVDITASIPLNQYKNTNLVAVLDPGVDAKFYVNEVWVATITTTLPSGDGAARDGLVSFYAGGPNSGTYNVRLEMLEAWN